MGEGLAGTHSTGRLCWKGLSVCSLEKTDKPKASRRKKKASSVKVKADIWSEETDTVAGPSRSGVRSESANLLLLGCWGPAAAAGVLAGCGHRSLTASRGDLPFQG